MTSHARSSQWRCKWLPRAHIQAFSEGRGLCYGSAMRSGAAVSIAVAAGLMVAFAGCGPQSPPAKAAAEAASASPTAIQNGNVAGAQAVVVGQVRDSASGDYPDPSKLLDSYDSAGEAGSASQAKPSNSGVQLEVRERGPDQPWLVHLTNRGDQPAELVADTRLLWFEVKLPGKDKQSLCRLPEPLWVGNQPEARLIVHLEPGEGVADQFDPRLYCFAEGDQKLLVPDAEVTPHFGWPEAPPKKRWKRGKLVEEPVLQKPPFVARQSAEPEAAAGQASSGRLSNRPTPKAAARLTSAGVSGADKQLEGRSLTLKSNYAAWTHQRSEARSDPQDVAAAPTSQDLAAAPTIALRLVQGSDARAEHDATVELTLSNASPLPVYVYFRREMVSFEVAGPAGLTSCPARLDDRTPERSAFLHMTRKAQHRYTSRLAELCPRGTFATPGLYLVYGRFDATLSGREQGIEAFVGPVYSQTPAPVRIRTGEQAIFQKRPMLRTGDPQATRVPPNGAP
jgi:hypothetical protein